MAVKVKEWKGAWWVFIDYQGRRKAKRVGSGKEGRRAAQAAAEKIQARLILGDTSLLDTPRPKVMALGQYAKAWHNESTTLPGAAQLRGDTGLCLTVAVPRKGWQPDDPRLFLATPMALANQACRGALS